MPGRENKGKLPAFEGENPAFQAQNEKFLMGFDILKREKRSTGESPQMDSPAVLPVRNGYFRRIER